MSDVTLRRTFGSILPMVQFYVGVSFLMARVEITMQLIITRKQATP